MCYHAATGAWKNRGCRDVAECRPDFSRTITPGSSDALDELPVAGAVGCVGTGEDLASGVARDSRMGSVTAAQSLAAANAKNVLASWARINEGRTNRSGRQENNFRVSR